ncbi:hypothetical protein AC579_3506 [Pseudocercospora musae]|uniref:Uncharacterized protein n=1 Tax=Pseudocercospora musae TaxID=113226 RepID=A0A139I3D3_9PEZI|nr:hypothetical protein AC579_3506 [Pseudocercospora musae]
MSMGFVSPKHYPDVRQPYVDAVSIALEKGLASDIIQIDKNHLVSIAERRKLLKEHLEVVVVVNDEIAAQAVEELHVWCICPIAFVPSSASWNPGFLRQELWKDVTKECHQLEPGPTACEALRAVGTIVEEDLVFLPARREYRQLYSNSFYQLLSK